MVPCLALSSSQRPSSTKAVIITEDSKYSPASSPLEVQKNGKSTLKRLKSQEMPTLRATRESIPALPCFNCFQAFLKKRLPHPNTTGALRATSNASLQGVSLKFMDTSITTKAAEMLAMAPIRRDFSSRWRMRSASSSRSGALASPASGSSGPASSSSSGTIRS